MASLRTSSLLSQWRPSLSRLTACRRRMRLQQLTPAINSAASLPGSASSLRTYAAISLFAPALLPLGLGSVPSLLADIWEAVLRAVPKKKTTHSRSRHRQMAGKALKDVTALNRCSACGNMKRAHLLCPFCVLDIQEMWKGKSKPAKENAGATTAQKS